MLSKAYKKRLLELAGISPYVSPIGAQRAAEIASLWHGGMKSAFYSLASTKQFFPHLWDRYQAELKSAPVNMDNPEEMEMLEQLDNWLKAQAAKYTPEQLSSEEDVPEPQPHISDPMLKGYLNAALELSSEEDGLTNTHTLDDFSLDAIQSSKKDIESFKVQAGDLLNGLDPSQVGNDLWLTRNGHGSGFWDRDYKDESVGERLTDIAKKMGTKDCYLQDNGEIGII